ncbi:MAG: response regulator transcription factor [Lachnospiraceae bacterium]|nr:response regulator transcription factor [Lachnospiraceae bacterium]
MSVLEICLIIIGLICVICSYLFSEHLLSGDVKDEIIDGVNVTSVTEEIVKREVEAEVANIIDDKIEEMEVKIDKLTTEKIMAMGEYSSDIQDKITQNHDEVMFLYNMLNDKEETLKNTIRDIEAVKASVKKMAIVNDVAKDVTKKAVTPEPIVVEESVNNITVDNMDDEATEPAVIEKAEAEAKPTQPREGIRKRPISNNNQMILDLYAKGKTNIEIAKELGLGIGEVRLVIDLFNSR